jgi:hypothetical protein
MLLAGKYWNVLRECSLPRYTSRGQQTDTDDSPMSMIDVLLPHPLDAYKDRKLLINYIRLMDTSPSLKFTRQDKNVRGCAEAKGGVSKLIHDNDASDTSFESVMNEHSQDGLIWIVHDAYQLANERLLKLLYEHHHLMNRLRYIFVYFLFNGLSSNFANLHLRGCTR